MRLRDLVVGGLAAIAGVALAVWLEHHRAPERAAFDRDWCVFRYCPKACQ